MPAYFYIKKNKSSDSIYFRFSFGRQKTYFTKFTGEKIPHNTWDSKKQKVKDKVSTYAFASKINKKLEKIETRFEQGTKGVDITPGLLEKIWNRLDEKQGITFTEYCENYYQWIQKNPNPSTKRPYSKETVKKYDQTIKKFKAFQEERYQVNFKGLDKSFHSDFISYFEDQGLAPNSIGVFVKYLKVMAKAASDTHPVNEFILSKDFYLPENDTYSIYCTIEEIERIKNWKTDNESLNNIRNWFIFGCWTGLRVGDWNRVKKIDTSGERWFIEIIPAKTKSTTGKAVSIPVHPWIREILEKGMPYKISEQKFNEGIKIVAREAGIIHKEYGAKVLNVGTKEDPIMRRKVDLFEKCELISSHTCRRSFATNNYLINMPTITIMAITGHSTEKNFLKYIKVTPRQHANKMAELWEQMF